MSKSYVYIYHIVLYLPSIFQGEFHLIERCQLSTCKWDFSL